MQNKDLFKIFENHIEKIMYVFVSVCEIFLQIETIIINIFLFKGTIWNIGQKFFIALYNINCYNVAYSIKFRGNGISLV